jgi:hypothetical protein
LAVGHAASITAPVIKVDNAVGSRASEPPPGLTGDRRCSLPAERGACKANFEAYHYVAGQRACRPFFWGGCGVTPFETREECEKACVRP